jgi:hypothetical protein
MKAPNPNHRHPAVIIIHEAKSGMPAAQGR